MIDAAESQHKKIGVQGRRYEGYMVWINALVASGGGQIIENADQGAEATPIDGVAGRRRGRRRSSGALARSSAAPPDLSTAGEEEARSLFQGDDGVVHGQLAVRLQRRQGRGGRRARSTSRWSTTSAGPATRRSTPGRPSAPPLGGINLGIGNFTEHPDEALAAVKCITSVESNVQYMVESGNPAARAAAYDDPAVREAFPMADLIRDSINDAGPRPDHAVLRRRVDLGAAHLAPAERRCTSPETPKETDTLHDRSAAGGAAAVTADRPSPRSRDDASPSRAGARDRRQQADGLGPAAPRAPARAAACRRRRSS